MQISLWKERFQNSSTYQNYRQKNAKRWGGPDTHCDLWSASPRLTLWEFKPVGAVSGRRAPLGRAPLLRRSYNLCCEVLTAAAKWWFLFIFREIIRNNVTHQESNLSKQLTGTSHITTEPACPDLECIVLNCSVIVGQIA